jgi:branched-chain amino acid transport system permease protein
VLRYVAKPVQEALFGHEVVAPEALRMLLFGLSMVVIMLYRPEGLWPAPEHGRAKDGAGGPAEPPPASPAADAGADAKAGGAR